MRWHCIAAHCHTCDSYVGRTSLCNFGIVPASREGIFSQYELPSVLSIPSAFPSNDICFPRGTSHPCYPKLAKRFRDCRFDLQFPCQPFCQATLLFACECRCPVATALPSIAGVCLPETLSLTHTGTTLSPGFLSLEGFVREDDECVFGIDVNSPSSNPKPLPGLRGTNHLVKLNVANTFQSLSELHLHLDSLDMTNTERLRPQWDTYFMAWNVLRSVHPKLTIPFPDPC